MRNGFDSRAAGRELGLTRQTVDYHVRRANAAVPLTYGRGDQEDRTAMGLGVRAVLQRAGISTEAE